MTIPGGPRALKAIRDRCECPGGVAYDCGEDAEIRFDGEALLDKCPGCNRSRKCGYGGCLYGGWKPA